MRVYDTQCGAKLFRAGEETLELFREPFLSAWVFDVEIVARLIRQRQRGECSSAETVVRELPLRRWHQVPGSKLRPMDFALALRELWRIWRRYLRPLRHARGAPR